ncbi:MAG TPA: TetR/AcrR family transcriptional regulator [Rugosimonospora sp.]|nr:TetR/AcrR family transcriptional regulator [Rugosimonospora sp.]
MTGQWVRAPRQERARRTFERVLDAGAELLAEQGYEGFAISEVCRRAQVSPGALYGRITSKDTLFLAIHQREMTRILAEVTALFADGPHWQALPLDALVVETIRRLGEHYRRHEALLRVFILRSAVDDRVRAEGEDASGRLLDLLSDLLLTRRDQLARIHADPTTAVRTVCRIAFDSLAWRTAFGIGFAEPQTTRSDNTEHWSERLSRVCATYLLTPDTR